MGEVFTISMIGPLRLCAPDGADLTPHGAKAQALIALLAEHRGHRRARRWLEARLWSDRSPAQASGSLRQTLSEIRKALGAHEGVLGSDRLMVWLDPARIAVDLDDPQARGRGDRDVLEGLDVRDPEFEDWLRALRQRHEPRIAARPTATTDRARTDRQILLTCSTASWATGADALIGRIIADQVGRNIGERVSVGQVAAPEPGPATGPATGPAPAHSSADPPPADIEIRCTASREAGQGALHLQILQCRDGRILYSAFRRADAGGDLLAEEFVSALAHEAAVGTLAQLPQAVGLEVGQAAATSFCNLALRKLWTFQPAQVAEAEALMRQAYGIDANGVYLAWIAFIRMARVIERNERPDAVFLDEVDALMRQALELAPLNAMVQALVALARALLFNDLEAGVRLASDALRLNPGNLFARQALALAGVAQGDSGQAHRLSAFCRTALGPDQGRHLWDLYHALVCLADGRIDEALAAARMSSARCPDFVAPRRLLVALHAWRDDAEAAEAQLAALARLEPGFSLDAYLRDDRYPVDTLRRTDLLRHAASIFGS